MRPYLGRANVGIGDVVIDLLHGLVDGYGREAGTPLSGSVANETGTKGVPK